LPEIQHTLTGRLKRRSPAASPQRRLAAFVADYVELSWN
jgi:hypothetical protein